jgi:mannose-6-phosphate isomerase
MCVGDHLNWNITAQKRNIKGDTVLIPAAMNAFILNGKASILEIYIS